MANQEVLDLFDELKALHIAKDADYAGKEPLSNFKRCEAFGIPAWKGCLIRLSDKYSRLVSLVEKGGERAVAGESVEDTLKDLSVYSILTLVLLRQAYGTGILNLGDQPGVTLKSMGPTIFDGIPENNSFDEW